MAFARDLAKEENSRQRMPEPGSGRGGTFHEGGADPERMPGAGAGAGKDSRGVAGRKAGIIGAAAAVLVMGVIICFALTKSGAMERKSEPVSLQVGETVLFGSYLDQDIAWRVLRISEDETQAVLIASHILTMKAYDAAESGRYNYDGDQNYWTAASQADTEVVAYSGQPPVAAAMAEKKNGYQAEPGFLYGFTREERDAIVETELVTRGNALSETDSVITLDRVWLLSLEELTWFDQAGMSKFTSPTEEAAGQDQSLWYSLDYDTYGVEYFCWWLREPVPYTASLCYLVNNGYGENP